MAGAPSSPAHVDEQPAREGARPRFGRSAQRPAEEVDALLDRERAALGRVVQHGDDDLVVERRGAGDDVDVPEVTGS